MAPPQWLLGVVLCLLGAAFTNLGLTLQKLSFLRLDALTAHLPPSSQPSACLQPLWLVGFSIFLVGQVGGMIAMGFSSQSVVATLGSFSLVTNAVFAPLILGEQLTAALVLSIVIIMAGSVVVILSSNHDNQDYTLSELMALFRRDLFVLYMTVLALCLAACVWMMVREHRRWRQQQQLQAGEGDSGDAINSDGESVQVPVSVSLPSSPRKPLLSPSASFDSVESEEAPASPASPQNAPTLSSFTPTLTAAILSSISVMLGKCTMQLIKTSVTGDNQFRSPVSFVLCAVFIVAAVASVHLLNTGLRRGAALFVVPFYYVSSTSLAIVGGLVYFEEFSRFSAPQMVVFFGGVALTVLGVWISTRGQMEEEEREAEEEDAEMEAALEAELEEEEEEEQEARAKEDEEKQQALTPTRSTPPSARSTASSPRSFTPREPAIAEEPEPDTEATAEEEERESAKRRRWHQKRAVSEPRLSFILPSPSKPGQLPADQYGSFDHTYPAVSAIPASPPPLIAAVGTSRSGRTQSMSLGGPVGVSMVNLHQHQPHHHGGRVGRARRSYTPHYTFAFYPVLPSNPSLGARKKSRSQSTAASRQPSPQLQTPRRLRL